MLLSFFLTRSIVLEGLKIQLKILNPTGGSFDKCIEPDFVYEVLYPALEIVIKQMLDLCTEAS